MKAVTVGMNNRDVPKLPNISPRGPGSETSSPRPQNGNGGALAAYRYALSQGPCAPKDPAAAAVPVPLPGFVGSLKQGTARSPRGEQSGTILSPRPPGRGNADGSLLNTFRSSKSTFKCSNHNGLLSTSAPATSRGQLQQTLVGYTTVGLEGQQPAGGSDEEAEQYQEVSAKQHIPHYLQQHQSGPPKLRPSKWEVSCKFASPIEKKVQQRLIALRKDPMKVEQLEHTLEEYEAAADAARAARAAGIHANKQEVTQLTAPVRLQQIRQQAEARDQRVQQVLQQHEARQAALLEAKVLSAQRDELRKEQRAAAEAAAAAAALHQQQVEVWSGMVRVVTLVRWSAAAAEQVAAKRLQLQQRTTAALLIQKIWRGHQQRRQYSSIRRAVAVMQKAWKGLFGDAAAMYTRRRKAAMMVLRFVSTCGGVPQLSLAVKRVQRTALREARLQKQLYVKRTTQLLLLKHQWNALEAELLGIIRKRTGADQLAAAGATAAVAASKATPRSVLAGAMDARKRAAANTGDVPDPSSMGTLDGGTPSSSTAAAAASAAAVAGPPAANCKATDRLVLESFEPVPEQLKGLVLQAYMRAKGKAYALMLGCYWRDKARGRRLVRQQMHMEAARSVVAGKSLPATAAAALAPNSNSSSSHSWGGGALTSANKAEVDWGGPPCPKFRGLVTLRELVMLMQQGVAETPSYLEHLARLELVVHRDALEQQLEQRRAEQANSTFNTPRSFTKLSGSAADGASAGGQLAAASGYGGIASDSGSGSMSVSGVVPPLPLSSLAGDSGADSSGVMSYRSGGPTPRRSAAAAAAAAKETWQGNMLRRAEACIRKRCVLFGTKLTSEMGQPVARRQDWEGEEQLMKKLMNMGLVNTTPSST